MLSSLKTGITLRVSRKAFMVVWTLEHNKNCVTVWKEKRNKVSKREKVKNPASFLGSSHLDDHHVTHPTSTSSGIRYCL